MLSWGPNPRDEKAISSKARGQRRYSVPLLQHLHQCRLQVPSLDLTLLQYHQPRSTSSDLLMTEDRCLHSFSLPYPSSYFFIILSIAASSGGIPKPAALILEGIAVAHASPLDHPWPILAGISFGHMTAPVVATCGIAIVPTIVAANICECSWLPRKLLQKILFPVESITCRPRGLLLMLF